MPPHRRVVLVDDRRAHCEAVAADRASRGQPFLGLHYVPASSCGQGESLPRGWQLLAAVLASPPWGRHTTARAAAASRLASFQDRVQIVPINFAALSTEAQVFKTSPGGAGWRSTTTSLPQD